ncbi:MAG TPA: phosphate ABC transporter substrate-binding protein PstS [Nitrospirota bacterium]|nr:phosphate ABC transporter substrate-binding protein PstS [Nitrospirota bacterium]
MRIYKAIHVALRGTASFLALIVLLGSVQGCSLQDGREKKVESPPGSVLLRGAGATFPSPLYKRWFDVYRENQPKTIITYDSVGSGEGIRRFIGKNVKEEELVDFGASDAAMSDEDIAKVQNSVVLLPFTAGSVVLAYNLPHMDVDLKLSRKAYAGIFQGDIKKWNDPAIAKTNPGVKLPNLSIATVVRQDSSGTTYAFTKHLDAISEKWRAEHGPATLLNWPGNAMRAKGNEGVAARISQSIGSIGYVSNEFARKLGLKLAVLENREGNFVKPTEQSCTAALATAEMPENLRVFVPDPSGQDAYPIVTFSWILLYKNYTDAEKAKSIRTLFQWCLLDGQKYAPQLGYVPLPAKVTDRILAALNAVGPR